MKILVIGPSHPELAAGSAPRVAYETFLGLKCVEDVVPIFLAAGIVDVSEDIGEDEPITKFKGRADEFIFHSDGYDNVWHRNHCATLASSFRAFIDYMRPDIVHFHHFINFGIDYLTLARLVLPDAKIVFTFHDFEPICAADGHLRYGRGRRDQGQCLSAASTNCHSCLPIFPAQHYALRTAWMKSHLSIADMFTAPSHFAVALYKKWGLEDSKVAYVANGLHADEGLVPNASSPGRNRFGFFGRLIDDKGIVPLLIAVEKLRAKGFTDFTVEINGADLHLASSVTRVAVQRHFANEEKNELPHRNLIYNGPYRPDELRARMAQIDWVVVPSLWREASCVVLSEAEACGRPVIASALGAPLERITDNENGMLVRPDHPEALADALLRACRERNLWERLQGRMSRNSRETMVRQFMSVYTTTAPRHSVSI